MKRLLAILTLLTGSCAAQAGNTVSFTASGAPTGSCSYIFRYIDSAAGTEYNCKAGAWNSVGGGAAGTAFSALTGSTNSTAAMIVGSGASLTTSGTGTITATATTGSPTLGKWLCGNHADGAGATWTCVSRVNVTSGDHLIAGCSGFLNDAGAATTTVADTLTTTWTRIGTEYFESSPQTYHITAFRGTAASSGADTITCTSTNAATTFTGSVLVSTIGDSAVDVSPGGNSGTNGSGDSLQLVTTAANDLCFQWQAGAIITKSGGTTVVYDATNGVALTMRSTGPTGNYMMSTTTGTNYGNIAFCLK